MGCGFAGEGQHRLQWRLCPCVSSVNPVRPHTERDSASSLKGGLRYGRLKEGATLAASFMNDVNTAEVLEDIVVQVNHAN